MAKKKATKGKATLTLEEATVALKQAKQAKLVYFKENKLKTGKDYSADKKHAKSVTAIDKAISEAEEVVTNLKAAAKSEKPAKEKKAKGVGRVSKYDYPADVVTSTQKKEYRKKKRAEAAKAEKGEAPAKSKKGKAAKAKAKDEKVVSKKAAKGKAEKTAKAKKGKKVQDEDED